MSVRRLLILVATVCLSGPMTAQSPTFSSRVESVRLDVLATDNGAPIKGLTAADFEVRDNGVVQTVDYVGFEQVPLAVVLTLDISSSVVGERLEHLRRAGGAVLDGLKTADQAALLTFTHALRDDARLTTDHASLRAVLENVEPRGDTALIDGAYAGINIADGASGRGLVILFSDGNDTASWLQESAAFDAARRSETVIYGVAAGARKPSFLRELTEATGGRLYEMENTRNLRAIFLSALEEFRQRYLLSYTPANVQKGGWHRLEVKVKGRRANIRARPGYLAG